MQGTGAVDWQQRRGKSENGRGTAQNGSKGSAWFGVVRWIRFGAAALVCIGRNGRGRAAIVGIGCRGAMWVGVVGQGSQGWAWSGG